MRTVNLLIVLDRSRAMSSALPGSGPIRWEAMKSALTTVLSKARLTVNFGLDFFPAADVTDTCAGDGCCAMPASSESPNIAVSPGVESVPEIVSALNNISPGGGAPAAAALARALAYYTVGDGRDLCGDKYVLFVTAGGPNCNPIAVPSCDASHCTRNLDSASDCDPATNCCAASAQAIACLDDQSVLGQIRALQAAGIRTMVAGLSSSDTYAPYLNALAVAGEMPNPDPNVAYYALGDGAGTGPLADALHGITVDLVRSCVIPFDTPPPDPVLVAVLVDCLVIPREPADGGDGSYWTLDLDAHTITLGGPICDQIIQPGVTRVDYVFGCARGGP
jgi:hypothetical protein